MSILSCAIEPHSHYSYRAPQDIHDGLQVGSLEDMGIRTSLIESAVNSILDGKFKGVHSILIYKEGKLVLEEYFQGHQYKWDGPSHHGELVTWNRDMLHNIHSDSKSITSICIGIAIDQGFIQNVHQSIFDYLPEYQHLKTDGKVKITIEHLLTMTSGLQWDEWGAPLSSVENDIIGLWFNCQDQVACILERPLVSEPGKSFTYSGGNVIVLGEIIKQATKIPIDDFSKKYLFEPLGIDSSFWSVQYPNGVIEAAGSLMITPRAMIKIGATLLNDGVWENKQIISKVWIEKSATIYGNIQGINIPGEPSGRNGYSYSWWIKTLNHAGKKIHMFSAGGWGGQHIMVIPELKTVVVFTGGNYVTKRFPFKILTRFIIPTLD